MTWHTRMPRPFAGRGSASRRRVLLSRRLACRRLSAIDAALTLEAPKLAAVFATFNALTKSEPPPDREQLRGSAWLHPRLVGLAVLVVLAAVVGVCTALSTHSARRCQVVTATAQSTPTAIGYVPVRFPVCRE